MKQKQSYLIVPDSLVAAVKSENIRYLIMTDEIQGLAKNICLVKQSSYKALTENLRPDLLVIQGIQTPINVLVNPALTANVKFYDSRKLYPYQMDETMRMSLPYILHSEPKQNLVINEFVNRPYHVVRFKNTDNKEYKMPKWPTGTVEEQSSEITVIYEEKSLIDALNSGKQDQLVGCYPLKEFNENSFYILADKAGGHNFALIKTGKKTTVYGKILPKDFITHPFHYTVDYFNFSEREMVHALPVQTTDLKTAKLRPMPK